MDIRLVKQPAVFGNVQVGIENFFFPNASYTDVYMYNETQKFYLHYAYIRTLTTKKPCEKYVFCVKRKKNEIENQTYSCNKYFRKALL